MIQIGFFGKSKITFLFKKIGSIKIALDMNTQSNYHFVEPVIAPIPKANAKRGSKRVVN
jgi:hypothetical protein